jgi:hypothetical protein
VKGKIEFRKSKFEIGMEASPSREEVALSLGERVDRDGAFTGRCWPGEGSLPFPGSSVGLANEAGFPLSRE